MGNGWRDKELLASVEAYRQMMEQHDAGVRLSKVKIYRELSGRFGRTAKAFEYRMQNISAVLDELGMQWLTGLRPATNVGTDMKSRLAPMIKSVFSQKTVSKNGFQKLRTWEKALAAVTELGGTPSRIQVMQWILDRDPRYNTKNLSDLYMMSVNSPARTGYSQNKNPRRTDQGSHYDRLFVVAPGAFELYSPNQHGVWEIFRDPNSGSRYLVSVRRVVSPVEIALAEAETLVAKSFGFDPEGAVDARARVSVDIVRRRGQPAFRKALIDAYQGRCAITGCDLPAVLEGAHVYPYKGAHTNHISNGLLLRADIHTLFDLRLIAVNSKTRAIHVSSELIDTEYGKLEGTLLRQPERDDQKVSIEALDWHWSQCAWRDEPFVN